jgi:hypothetical protein
MGVGAPAGIVSCGDPVILHSRPIHAKISRLMISTVGRNLKKGAFAETGFTLCGLVTGNLERREEAV